MEIHPPPESPRKEPEAPWGIGEAIILFVAFIILNILSGVVLGFVYVIAVPGGSAVLKSGALPGWTVAIMSGVSQIGTLVLIYAFVRLYHGMPFREGMAWRGRCDKVKTAVKAGLLLALINGLLGPMIFPPDVENIPIYQMVSTWLDLVAMSVLAIGVAPIVEEMLYRGVMYPAFARKINPVAAIVVVSIFFALPHAFQLGDYVFGVFQVGLLGALAGYFRMKSGGVRDAFYCHLSYNVLLLIMESLNRIFGESPV